MSIQPMDWSATAAWIALAISILGTTASPIITARITNKHQLKLRKLDYEQERVDALNSARTQAIADFISGTGKFLSHPNSETVISWGQSYHMVYPYIPNNLWEDVDLLYDLSISRDYTKARELFTQLTHKLADLLKEPLQ